MRLLFTHLPYKVQIKRNISFWNVLNTTMNNNNKSYQFLDTRRWKTFQTVRQPNQHDLCKSLLLLTVFFIKRMFTMMLCRGVIKWVTLWSRDGNHYWKLRVILITTFRHVIFSPVIVNAIKQIFVQINAILLM